MDLNLKNKAIIINTDTIGIAKRLNTEGAIPIIKNKKNYCDNIHNKAIKLNAYINIRDINDIENNNDFLQTYYNAKYLTDDFTIINVGTRNTLGIKKNSYRNDVLCFDKNYKSLEQKLNIKSINIVYPEYPTINKSDLLAKEYLVDINEHIVDSITFYISKKATLINGQIIFIDNGLHLLQSVSLNSFIN